MKAFTKETIGLSYETLCAKHAWMGFTTGFPSKTDLERLWNQTRQDHGFSAITDKTTWKRKSIRVWHFVELIANKKTLLFVYVNSKAELFQQDKALLPAFPFIENWLFTARKIWGFEPNEAIRRF